jgi:hypothetical protein
VGGEKIKIKICWWEGRGYSCQTKIESCRADQRIFMFLTDSSFDSGLSN